MKTIIAGSRNITDINLLKQAILESKFHITEVVCGGARGVDILGREWALDYNISVVEFPAQWNQFGKSAGYIRNSEMANYGEALIALWDGKSKGTQHMINLAKKKKLKYYIKEMV